MKLVNLYSTGATDSGTYQKTNYIVTSNATSCYITDEVYHYIPETFDYFKGPETSFSIFPFDIKQIITHVVGSLGTKWDNIEYHVYLNKKMICGFCPGRPLTTEELEIKLAPESKKWLDSQMISSWKTPTTTLK